MQMKKYLRHGFKRFQHKNREKLKENSYKPKERWKIKQMEQNQDSYFAFNCHFIIKSSHFKFLCRNINTKLARQSRKYFSEIKTP